MENDRLEVGALLQRIWMVLAAAPAATIAFLVAMTALGSIVDLWTQESVGGYFWVMVANFVAGYFLLKAMLRGCGLLREGQGGGFGAYFVVSFLAGLGTLFGFLLLIIPGLVLMVRWSAAFAIALSEDEDASDALGESWQITGGSFWPIFAAILIGLVPLFAIIIGFSASLAFSTAANDEIPLSSAEIVVTNLVSSAYSLYSSALGIAVYWMLRGERRDISDVFA